MGPEVLLYNLLFTPQGQALLRSSAQLAGEVSGKIADLIGIASNPKVPDLDLDGGWPIVIHVDPEPKKDGPTQLDDLFGIPGSGFSGIPTDPVKNELARGICLGDIANKYGSKVAKELGISFTDLSYGGFYIKGSGGGPFGSDKLFRARCPENTVFMGFDCDGNPRCIPILTLIYKDTQFLRQYVESKDPIPPKDPPEPKPKPKPEVKPVATGSGNNFPDCFNKWFAYFKKQGLTNQEAQIKAHHICVPAISGDAVPPPPEPKPETSREALPSTSGTLDSFWKKCYLEWMSYFLSAGLPFNLAHAMAIEVCKTVYTKGSFKTPPLPEKRQSGGGLFSDLDSRSQQEQRKSSLPSHSEKIQNMTKEIFLNWILPKKY